MKNVQLIIVLLLSTGIICSCSKWDGFKKYIQDGEILYTGKMDSVKIHSGKERIQLYGLLKSDPKLSKIVISWDNGADSAAYDYVKQYAGIDTFIRIIPVSEGVKSFKVITYDGAGNKSVDVFAIGTSYGDGFRKRMADRPVTSLTYSDAGTTVNWDVMDLSTGPKYTEVQYNDNGSTKTVTVPITDGSTLLPGVKLVPPLYYRTIFRPDATCIDTFATALQPHNVIADVTGLYLSNTGPGFARNTFDGRWGTLAPPWITNAAAKNKGGVNGGYTSDSRWGYSGQICWETWGSTPVVDGKIYQVTSAPLPAGTYTLSFQYYSEIQSNSTVHCIVAEGGGGIPSLPGLSTALGSAALYNGVPAGATAPSMEETRSIDFILTEPKLMSIGFLGNIVGNGNPGSYFVVRNITLVKK
ncbi:DUF4998 domain-containing protein [Niabella drilacis]|uniref:DUF5013 domain-containing protein n=1 Tax=Niabella drilacis (strain DSM 25811 / CCM 8410 / CCUG 62505 / LMG 26954 / E90) TaxID=1285928 RepID=A0A1G6J9Z6_NIADE|nr:DUF4998 domain-containing protein [Niabella drilacis]SDC15509.1 protein of unknown function [Niabella drilacis]